MAKAVALAKAGENRKAAKDGSSHSINIEEKLTSM